jgi:hypothetical protein
MRTHANMNHNFKKTDTKNLIKFYSLYINNEMENNKYFMLLISATYRIVKLHFKIILVM